MRLLFTLAIGLVLCTGLARAAAPAHMTYQGRLTTSSGTPVADGTYSVVFTIYDLPSAGTVIWTETQDVSTSDGHFTVQLGIINNLNAAYFSSPGRYLGIQVGADPEMTPRCPLNSVPWALRLETIDNASGGLINGDINANTDGGGWAYLRGFSGLGAGLDLTDETAFVHTYLDPDPNGSGGLFQVMNGNGTGAFLVDGNNAGTGDARVTMSGTGGSADFDLAQTGDLFASLPDDAISSPEILDEPGVASDKGPTSVSLTASMQDLATVTITIPAAGYVVLTGNTPLVNLSGTTSYNLVRIQIDETAGGSLDPYYASTVGAQAFGSTSTYSYSVAAHRIYSKPAGTYTFRLEGTVDAGLGGTATAYYPTLTAMYFPTSYGSVSTIVSASEASEFLTAVPIAPQAISTASGAISAEESYLVDLRELELKAARERAEYEAAQRKLVEAQLQEQLKDRAVFEPRR